VLAAVVVLVLAGDVYALRRNNTTPVDVGEAVQRFHQQPGATGGAEPTTTSAPGPEPPAPIGSTTVPPPGGVASASPPPVPAPGAPVAPGDLRPPAGVYRYRTDGSEQLSIGGSRRYPQVTTRTVRHGGGCTWTLEIALVEEHREQVSFCGTAQTLDLNASRADVRWFGVSYPSEFTCSPPIRHVDRAATPGATVPFSCRQSDGSTFTGTSVLGVVERVDVGGESRPAWRFRLDGRFEGKTHGTVAVTELIDQATGVTLIEQRTNDLKQSTLLGDVGYRQELSVTIVSVTPQS
jgi:hypothetical protein